LEAPLGAPNADYDDLGCRAFCNESNDGFVDAPIDADVRNLRIEKVLAVVHIDDWIARLGRIPPTSGHGPARAEELVALGRIARWKPDVDVARLNELGGEIPVAV
jgi:hypothetical protein